MHQRFNGTWPFGFSNNHINSNQASVFDQLTPAHLLMLQSQIQHANHNNNNIQNLDLFLSSIQETNNNNNINNPTDPSAKLAQRTTNQNKNQSLPFRSSFSVNSLLNSDLIPLSNIEKLQSSSSQNFATALTQHLTVAMANYRLNQQQQLLQQQCSRQAENLSSRSPLESMRENEVSAFQAPLHKKVKISNENEINCTDSHEYLNSNQNPLNSSSCSISSPSSSSSSVFSTSSSSFDFCNHENPTTSLEHIHRLNLNMINALQTDANHNCNTNKNKNSSSPYLNDSSDSCNNNNSSEKSSSDASIAPRLRKTRSNRKISIDLQNLFCPICRISLHHNELQSHLDSELAKLDKLNCLNGLSSNEESYGLPASNRKRTSSGSEKSSNSSIVLEIGSRSQEMKSAVLNKIKENRQSRLTSKLCSRMKENRKTKTLLCPLCNKSISDSKEEINIHLESCSVLLKENNSETKSEDSLSDDSSAGRLMKTSESNKNENLLFIEKNIFDTNSNNADDTNESECSEENYDDLLLKKEDEIGQKNQNNIKSFSISELESYYN